MPLPAASTSSQPTVMSASLIKCWLARWVVVNVPPFGEPPHNRTLIDTGCQLKGQTPPDGNPP